MAEVEAAAAPPAAAPAAEGEVKKPSRGRPKDDQAPPKPKNPFQKVTGEARARLKAEKPELATDLKAMGLALKDAWDQTPEAEKERMQKEYETEMEIWKPKWAAYKETDHYKKFFEIKQDWMDIKQKKKLIKTHMRGKLVEGNKVRSGGKFTHEFPDDPTKSYDLVVGQIGTVEAVKIDEDGNARVNWGPETGSRVLLKKYFGKIEDPDIPKRPKSGYMIHAGEIRDRVAKEVEAAGGNPLKDVGAKIAEYWTNLSEAKKAEYGERAAQMKEKFDKEFTTYRVTEKFKEFENKKVNLDSKQKLAKLQRTKLDEAPKKAKSAFALYRSEVMPNILAENKEKGITMTTGDLGKKIGEMWAAVPEEQKVPYNEKAAVLKEEYEKNHKGFKKTSKYLQFLEERQKVKIRQNRMVNLRDMPKKPKSVFALFAAEHKSEVPAGKGEGKGTSALKTLFASAAQEEKAKLEEKAKEALGKWKEEVETYKAGEKFQEYVKTEKKVKQEFLNEAMKVMTIKFLNAAPPQPPKSPFSIYVAEKRQASGPPEGEKKSKEAKREEVVKFQEEWKKLDKEVKAEFDARKKEKLKEWQEQVKEFCEQELWKEYLAEAKRLKVPIKHLLSNKKNAIKRLKNGMRVVALPDKPEDFPSRPPSAFKIFCREKKQETNDLEKIREMWNELDAEGKKKYQDDEVELRKKYDEEMKAFRMSDDGKTYIRSLNQALRSKRMVKAKFTYLKDLPKKPPSALKVYLEQHTKTEKKANPEMKGFEIRKILQDRWLAMPEEEKKPLQEAAEAKMKAFEEAMKEFKAGENWKAFQKAVKPKGKAKGKGKGKAKGKAKAGPPAPPKPEGMPEKPPNAFKAFCKEMTGSGKDLGALHQAFRELDADDKKAREEKFQEAEKKYKEELAEFNKTDAGKKYLRDVASFEKRLRVGRAKAKYMKDAPKRPQSAQMMFFAEKRSEVMKENPDLKGLGPVQNKLAEIWRGLSEEDKQVYKDKEAEANKEYNEKLTEFQNSAGFKKFKAMTSGGGGKSKGKAKAKKSVGPAPPEVPANFPKKPPQAYFLFRSKTQGNSKEVHAKWLALGAEGQAEWNKEAKEKSDAYDKEMKEFQKSADGKKYLRLKAAYDKKLRETKIKEKFLGGADAPKEPKRPQTAYFLFVADKRASVVQELGTGKLSEVASKLTQLWGSLEKDEKEAYEEKAKALKKEYDEAMEEYKKNDNVQKLDKALQGLKKSGKPKRAAKPKAKPAAKKAAGRGRGAGGGGKGRGRGAAAAKDDDKKSSDSDSDVMGSDSDSSSDDSDSD